MRAQPTRSALKIGYLVSAALHLVALLGVPGWQLPEQREPLRIEARLLSVPSEVAPVASAKPPTPPPTRRAEGREKAPSSELAAPAPVTQSEPEAVPALAQSAPEAASAPLAQSVPVPTAQSEPADGVRNLTDLRDWPVAGVVQFDASLSGLPAGEAEHVWSHDALQYNARLNLRSAGLVRLAYRYDAQQETQGRLVGNNLRVERYVEQANTRHFESLFDHVAGVVRQDRNGAKREVEAKGVALDILSLLHFLGGQPASAEAFDIFVVSPRASVARVTVLQKAPRERELPVGRVLVRPFVAEARGGELYIEVDLASAWRNAPVRIFIEDRKQDLKLELRAAQVDIEGTVLARRQPPPPEPDTD